MRRVLFPLISAIAWLSLASGLAAQAPQWKEFSNETDGFRALFPSPPEFTRSSVPIAGDIFELHSYDAQVGTAALYIGVCDYGAKGVAADPEELLASARQGAVEHMHAHLVSEKHIALDASTGTAFEAESDRLHFSVRMVLSGGALYQIMVSAPLSEPFAESTRFLDSLASIPPTRPAGAAPLSAADWKPYPYPSDGFSVALPHQPSIEKQTVSSDAGPFDLRTYVAEDGSAVLITTPRAGRLTAAATGTPPTTRATWTAQSDRPGSPNSRVPSSGSMIQTRDAPTRDGSSAPSSESTASSGRSRANAAVSRR